MKRYLNSFVRDRFPTHRGQYPAREPLNILVNIYFYIYSMWQDGIRFTVLCFKFYTGPFLLSEKAAGFFSFVLTLIFPLAVEYDPSGFNVNISP
jgi:hypothetical protein